MSETQVKTCDKKLKAAVLKVSKILSKIDSLKLNGTYVSKLNVKGKGFAFSASRRTKVSALVAFLAILIGGGWWLYENWPSDSGCLVSTPAHWTVFRPPEQCSMCREVRQVVRLANTSAAEFEKHAYSAAPVIVTDAMRGWRAVEEFSFKFFKDFYSNEKMGNPINTCYFFPYKSGFHSTEEAFAMDEARANLSGEPWYIGWSTCHDEETRKLREYYTRPYFLPRTAESGIVDWIFMGGPGQGAHMHLDKVRHMSWQAQVSGRKRWVLAPPTECLYQCQWLSFTVAPGEILVVDTNRWFHQTSVLPGDISITIGAEYD